MNRKVKIVFLIFLLVGIGVVGEYFTQNIVFMKVLYPIREVIGTTYEKIEEGWKRYITQAQTIQQLRNENRKLQQYALLYQDAVEKCQELQQISNPSFLQTGQKALLFPALGYVHYGDYTSLYLKKVAPLDKKRIYALTYGDYAAGIARYNAQGRLVAYLNGNRKCSYGVMIGKLKAQGVATGTGDNRIIEVRYIPRYIKVAIGDEVVTSGLDGIFPYGIPVGKVVDLQQTGSYTIATVRPYANLSHPRFFWLIKL